MKTLKFNDVHNKFFKIKKTGTFHFVVFAKTDDKLNVNGLEFITVSNTKKLPRNWNNRKTEYLPSSDFNKIEIIDPETLSGPYFPGADSCTILDTIVPDSMDYEIHEAVSRIKHEVGGSLENFVMERLHYSKEELCKSVAAEQIDAVAMAIYNIEFRGQGIIIGDQTGIGKGRVAACMMRYAHKQNILPIFLTEKANLFSDIYRDLKAIGSASIRPFIVNANEAKTKVKDENGDIIYEPPAKTEQDRVFKNKKLDEKYDCVLSTYSQFNSPEKSPLKPEFLMSIARGAIIILDESHNASGLSNTGEFLQKVVDITRGTVFLSATFAKRPDNMPIYAMKTAMSEANMPKEQLVEAIINGGVALQEIIASQLVEEGQMIRRERSFDGVEVNYITLDADGERNYGVPDKEQEHKAIVDNITSVLRDIIKFQADYITSLIERMDQVAAATNKEIKKRGGTSELGVSNTPYFSKVFNVVNQMLFSIKAQAVAERAIARLKEGKKPIIAFASTMGSFLEQMENQNGQPVTNGDTINTDFGLVLAKGLETIMKYTEHDEAGNPQYKLFSIDELPPEAQTRYQEILNKIKKISSGITISPIDVIRQVIEKAGYRVSEVTGRKLEVQLNLQTNMGVVMNRKKENVNDAFRRFNNNQVDVLLINQSGSTGASAHAIVTEKVTVERVKQRVMIVLQPELNINTEIQKRGRVNRTGQIYKPIYDYMNSAIPAEKRLMMMLQKKLKSLDANTTSSQKQSKKILSVDDFLNKYGDKIVVAYLQENPDLNEVLGDPCKISDENTDEPITENAASKVSGRVAVLSTKDQEAFYNDINERYKKYIEYLQQRGEYDLEVEAMNLESVTMTEKVIKVGSGGQSAFGDDSLIETIECNVLRKPFTRAELDNLLKESLDGNSASQVQQKIMTNYKDFVLNLIEQTKKEIEEEHEKAKKNITLEPKYKKLKDEKDKIEYTNQRKQEIDQAKADKIKIMEQKENNKYRYLSGLFKFFTIGRGLQYPTESFDQGQLLTPAVFIGFNIDQRKKNPYAPSSIDLRFALADSNKYLTIPASFSNDVNGIMGASQGMYDWEKQEITENWDELIKKSSKNRQVRYVITGNLLQAFADFKGKLVSYTLMEGGVKKGILMPENWKLPEGMRVLVPIKKAIQIIKSLKWGSTLTTDNDVSFINEYGDYKIIVPASNKRGGQFYKDSEILSLVVSQDGFNKQSDKMVATVKSGQIEKLIDILDNRYKSNVELSPSQFELISADIKRKVKKKQDEVPKIIELEAHYLVETRQAAGIGMHPKIKTI